MNKSKYLIIIFTILFGISIYTVPKVFAGNLNQQNSYNNTISVTTTNFDETNPSLTSPNTANAGLFSTIKTAYQLYKGMSSVDADRPTWVVTTLAIDATSNLALSTFCGSGKDVDAMAIDDQKCVDLPKSKFAMSSENEKMFAQGILPGGAAGLIYYAYDYVETEEPTFTDLALYFQDATKDTIFGTPAYAASQVNNTMFEMVVLNIWKLARNIAVMLLGIIVAAAGIMIIFRKKISAQAVISIYNVLPRIPIIFGLIILSYPIGAFLLSLAGPLSWFAVKTGGSLIWDAITQDSLPNAAFSYLLVAGINVAFALMGAGPLAFITIFLGIILGITIIVVLVLILFNILKAYVSIMINVMLSPFIIMVGIIPGKETSIIELGKKLVVDIISVPAMILVAFVGAAVVVGAPHHDWDIANIGTLIMFSYFVLIIKLVIGIIIMWQAVKVRGKLQKAFGIGAQRR